MATTPCGPVALALQSLEDVQPQHRPQKPSPWGDFFLTHQPCTPAELLSMKERALVVKEEVRSIVLDAAAAPDLTRKMDLVDMLERLGLDYHYRKEIDELVRAINDDKDDEAGSPDLYNTSLRFYLLRKHGYTVSSDTFLKFRDDKGNIVTDDTRCLLKLYDAAHLRVHGEEILDNIIIFTKRQLQCLAEYLEPELMKEVKYALKTPLFRRLNRVEARRYIAIYEKKTALNDRILEFAKLDFNILLTLYCVELKDLTLWWKDFQMQANTSIYSRDRMVEMHFWMLGVFFEPQYSYSRKMLAQLFMIVSVLDDLYDSYCTTEDGSVFASALEKWDEGAVEQCPTYLRTLYKNILTTVKAIEEELKLQNNKHSMLVKRLLIDMAKCYHAEVEWRDMKYVPATEHLEVSARTSGCMHVTNQGFILMGDVATTEAIEWTYTYPKIIKAVCIIARLNNDIMSYKREKESKNMASAVQACAKEYGITIKEATEKLRDIIEEAWMDITEECLRQPQPMVLLERAVNLARTMDFLYKDVDGYTDSQYIKGTLDSLYVDLVH